MHLHVKDNLNYASHLIAIIKARNVLAFVGFFNLRLP